jgi:hypothetical protein
MLANPGQGERLPGITKRQPHTLASMHLSTNLNLPHKRFMKDTERQHQAKSATMFRLEYQFGRDLAFGGHWDQVAVVGEC